MSNRMLDTLVVFKTKITKEDIDSIKDKSSIEDFNKKVVHYSSREEEFEDMFVKGVKPHNICTNNQEWLGAYYEFYYKKIHQ